MAQEKIGTKKCTSAKLGKHGKMKHMLKIFKMIFARFLKSSYQV